MVFFIIDFLQANGGDLDQTPRSVESGLGLHYLRTSYKKDARLIWVEHKSQEILTLLNAVSHDTD